MRKTNYISPEIDLHNFAAETGFGLSQQNPDINIGIGGWEVDNEDYGNNAY